MPQITLKPPQYSSQPLNTGDSSERGVSPKELVESIEQMFSEIYAIVGSILQLKPFTVATQPDPTASAGQIIYVSDGAAGEPVIAFSDGTSWLRSDDRTEIAAS